MENRGGHRSPDMNGCIIKDSNQGSEEREHSFTRICDYGTVHVQDQEHTSWGYGTWLRSRRQVRVSYGVGVEKEETILD